jgi:hypothetical protein
MTRFRIAGIVLILNAASCGGSGSGLANGGNDAATRSEGGDRDTGSDDGSPSGDDAPTDASWPEVQAVDSDASNDAEASPEGAAGACNTLVNSARLIQGVQQSGQPPAPMGMTIADGLYESSAYDLYGTGTIGTRRATLQISAGGTVFEWVIELTTSTGPTQAHLNTRAHPVQLVLNQTSTCASPLGRMPDSVGYTATPTQLLLIDTVGQGTYVTTYAKTR